jgi:hypothetical protein
MVASDQMSTRCLAEPAFEFVPGYPFTQTPKIPGFAHNEGPANSERQCVLTDDSVRSSFSSVATPISASFASPVPVTATSDENMEYFGHQISPSSAEAQANPLAFQNTLPTPKVYFRASQASFPPPKPISPGLSSFSPHLQECQAVPVHVPAPVRVKKAPVLRTPFEPQKQAKDQHRDLRQGQAQDQLQAPYVQVHSHNQIEKRYRINLNRKIAILRDSVPSIRRQLKFSCPPPPLPAYDPDNPNDINRTLRSRRPISISTPPPPPVNKATVMEEATKYIKTLERNVQVLQDEKMLMETQLMHLKKLTNMNMDVPMCIQPLASQHDGSHKQDHGLLAGGLASVPDEKA